MAPEQVEGRNIDQRADIYALGLIVYEMLTGNSAFAGDTPMAVAYKQVHEAPPAPRSIDPTIPENVQALILRCIEKEPERRFREIRELEAVLAELGHRSPTTHIHPRPEVPRRNTTTFIMARRKARLLMAAVQILYLSIYAAALYYDDSVGRILETVFEINATIGVRVVYVLAMCGIAARVYISSALAWDHPDLPVQFRRLFPLLWLLDSIWAASPLLLLDKLRFGMILGCIALLAYVPFSQRTLMENLSTDNPLRPL
jgi:hypothetical protein